jgi:putative PEP-CTERM system histidine kinase
VGHQEGIDRQVSIYWQNVPFIVNGIASAAFLVLSVMAGLTWQGQRRGGLLILAVTVTFLAAVSASLMAVVPTVGFHRLASFSQGAAGVGWLVFLFDLLRPDEDGRGEGFWLKRWVYWCILAVAAALLLAHAVPLAGVSDQTAWLQMALIAQLAIGVIGLVLVEQVFRNALGRKRWAIKYLCFGLGGLFCFDLFVYSEALLLGFVDQDLWDARGVLLVLLAPLVAVTAARNRHWSVDVFVSRTAVAHSAALLGTGIYLIGVAAAGYLIREYGGRWGAAVQLGFLFAALLLLGSLFLSSQLRARAKIFLHKHFFSYKYDYRDEWLRFIGALTSAQNDDVAGRAIRAMCRFLNSPGGVLWKGNHAGDFVLFAEAGGAIPNLADFARDDAMVRFLGQTGWVIDLDEYRKDPGRYPGLDVPDWLDPNSGAWIVVPLLLRDALWGILVLNRPGVGRPLNWEDHDLLKTAGQQVSSYLAFTDATERLVESRQFDAFNRLSAYIVHDLKNVAAQLSLVVTNSRRYWDNPEFQTDALATVENATRRMNQMLADLQKGPRSDDSGVRVTDVNNTIESVVERKRGNLPQPRADLLERNLAIRVEPQRFANVLEHLVQNAQEATPSDGEVILGARADGEWVAIEVRDSGCGMDRAFLNDRLFKPFDTTKGNAGMGIGAYESREFAKASGGSISVESTPDQGTRFVMWFPRVMPPADPRVDPQLAGTEEPETGR